MTNRCRVLAAAMLALTVASVASAQDASSSQTAAPAGAPGPLVLEKVRNGFVVTPDYKVTELNGDLGQLAGCKVGLVKAGALDADRLSGQQPLPVGREVHLVGAGDTRIAAKNRDALPAIHGHEFDLRRAIPHADHCPPSVDRKSTRLNSSHRT